MKKGKSKKGESGGEGLVWRGRLWLEGPEGTFLGWGRVVLLERIGIYGSISQAARSMNMSYKHAWDLLDSMNRQAGRKLVETSRGGRKGGGAVLTRAGEEAISVFRDFYGRFQRALRKMTEELEAGKGSGLRPELKTAGSDACSGNLSGKH